MVVRNFLKGNEVNLSNFKQIDNQMHLSDAYSEPCQISNMELFAKTFFPKTSILDVWYRSEYVSVCRRSTQM